MMHRRSQLLSQGHIIALMATAVALLVLAAADVVTPYGWKVFVLAKIFKMGWDVSVAFGVALFLPKLLEGSPAGGNSESRPREWAVAFTAFATALFSLGYLMPDWNPWSELIAGFFLAGWAVITFTIRARSN
jgi:hypothetical protein